jgi:hypothetical protein
MMDSLHVCKFGAHQNFFSLLTLAPSSYQTQFKFFKMRKKHPLTMMMNFQMRHIKFRHDKMSR